MLNSQKLLEQKDRELLELAHMPDSLTIRCLNALRIAETEIELLREKLHAANVEISGLSESSKLKKVTIWCKSNENEDYCPFYYFLTEKEVDDFVEENELCDRSSYEIETFIGSNIHKRALNKNK